MPSGRNLVNDMSHNPDLLPEGHFAATHMYTDNYPLSGARAKAGLNGRSSTRPRRVPPPAHLQARVARWTIDRRGQMARFVENVLVLWCSERQAAPRRTHLPLRVWTRYRSRPQCSTKPRRLWVANRGREWPETENVRGGEHRLSDRPPSPWKREDGSALAEKAVTASSQGEAARVTATGDYSSATVPLFRWTDARCGHALSKARKDSRSALLAALERSVGTELTSRRV
jgi:hypothetical protein